MKKFTLFLGALLISMVSMAAEATISFADVANRKTLTDNQQVWEQNGLIVTGNKSASTTNVADYSNPARFYQGSSLTIKCTLGNITKIVIDGNTAKPVEAIQTSIGEEATIDGNIVTVIPKNQTSDTYVIEKFSAQVRINAITVTYAAAGETPETPEEPENPEEPEQPNDSVDTPELPEGTITCAEAVAICEQVGTTGTTEEYTVRGYITEIKYAWSEQYGTATFWIADAKDGENTLQAYSCAPLKDADKVFAVGAYVELVGKLKKFNTTNEVEKGTYTIITPAEGGTTPEEPETPEVETVGDGTEANPFTVEDVIALNNTLSGKHYVKAYIVGQAVGQSFVDGLDTEAPFVAAEGSTQGTNLAIASTLTPDTANIIPVQLPKGDLRNDFNLVENPDKLGAQVLIYGDLIKYFNLPGIKNTTSIVVVGETPDDGGETPDDGGETPANVTFDFTTKDGLEALGIAYPTTDAGNGACATDLEEGKAYSQNGISLTAKYGSTATRIWLAANGKLDLRHYKGGVLTFAAPSGKVITNIVFDGADVSGLTTLVDNAWNGLAAVVEIPAASDANTIKINTIKVHVADASSDFVATPVISGEADFLENTTVTITAEEGLEVYYTLDGTDPTKASIKYTAPFELTATTTVKAIAYNGDKASAVVEKKFTKMTILTCAEAVALCTNPATPGQHIIRGYVTEMIEAYNDQYKNITFWMADTPDGGQVLQAFRVKPVSDVEQALKVGDFVEVIGSLILYTKDGVSIPEVNAGGSVELINAAPSAVDNITIDQNAVKFIENGQLVIVKDGVRYNALGQVTK